MTAEIDLVTGGNGFIGRHLVHALKARGRTVRVLDQSAEDALVGADEHMQGSILDPAIVSRAVAGAQRVFHVAGNPQLWARRGFDDDNRSGAELVMLAAYRAGAERIVLTSTHAIDVRGNGSRSLADMPGPYTRAKFLAEQAAIELIAQGAPVTIVAPTMPLGPGDHNLTPPTQMVLEFLQRRNPAYLDFETNLIDVREVAEGHVLAAERGEIGQRYILGRHNLMLSDLLETLQRLSGVSMPTRRIPYALAWASAVVMQTASGLTGRRPRASLEGVRLARYLAKVPDNPTEVLGLKPIPLETLLRDCIDDLGQRKLWSPDG